MAEYPQTRTIQVRFIRPEDDLHGANGVVIGRIGMVAFPRDDDWVTVAVDDVTMKLPARMKVTVTRHKRSLF